MQRFFLAALALSFVSASAAPVHVWEKVEITLHAKGTYASPYTDAEVWVELKGPGFEKRCYGFWDGGDTFRVRVMATAPGKWTWRSGSRPEDAGLSGQSGEFEALAWKESEKEANPNRRGMIRASANGHAFDYADGTPYFLMGDTWWATPTFRFPWREEQTPRPMGLEAGFQDYVRLRREQGYNCIAILAALPNWANDEHSSRLNMPDGTVLRFAWGQAGTKSAKAMHTETGENAFVFPGKVPGFEKVIPDLERVNPAYFQALDRKMDYLNEQGFVPFIEVARRDIGQVWKKFYPWPQSYSRFIQYVWTRYQANICTFSPIHFDSSGASIPLAEWRVPVMEQFTHYGPPPFGTPVSHNANPSSLVNWGHVDKAPWLTFHQIGNSPRTHDSYPYLNKIFAAKPALPGINGEPYYDGMEDAKPGSEMAALYCRSAMYGSVLSGGLGGHIYGAGGWSGGLWSGEVEAASKYPIWEVVKWPSADQMRHLKTFVLSEGRRYQDLQPLIDSLQPNRSGDPKGFLGWAFAAGTAGRDLFLIYFEQDCPAATLAGTQAGRGYRTQWFHPATGVWLDAQTVKADAKGTVKLPPFPDTPEKSAGDWAMKLTLIP